jgi:hypothetical protein
MTFKTAFFALPLLLSIVSCDAGFPGLGTWTATGDVNWGLAVKSTTVRFSVFPDGSGLFIRKIETVDYDGYGGSITVGAATLSASYSRILDHYLWSTPSSPVILNYQYSVTGAIMTLTVDGNNDAVFDTANAFGTPTFDPSQTVDATYILTKF